MDNFTFEKPEAVEVDNKIVWTSEANGLFRLEVPGGWIYRFSAEQNHSVTFVPFDEDELIARRDRLLAKIEMKYLPKK